jgi:hypothetical protein
MCEQGSCGPGWTDCQAGNADVLPNCNAICNAGGITCNPGGCSGYTALLFDVGFFDGTCGPNIMDPAVTMTGSCDEPLPWLVTDETERLAMCCCDLQ